MSVKPNKCKCPKSGAKTVQKTKDGFKCPRCGGIVK